MCLVGRLFKGQHKQYLLESRADRAASASAFVLAVQITKRPFVGRATL